MIGYRTTYHGPPYAFDGEEGPEVPTILDAQDLARRTLNPSQRLRVFEGDTLVAEYAMPAGHTSVYDVGIMGWA